MEVEPSSPQQVAAPSGFLNGRYSQPGQKAYWGDDPHHFSYREGFRDVPQANIPSSVLSHMRQKGPLLSSGPSTFNEQGRKTRTNRRYITIADLQQPRYHHFNSHGEAIMPQTLPVNNGMNQPEPPRLCPACFSTNLSIGGHCLNCHPTAMVNCHPTAMVNCHPTAMVNRNPNHITPHIFGIDSTSLPPSMSSDFSTNSRASTTQRNVPSSILDVKQMNVDVEGTGDPRGLRFSRGVSAIKSSTDRNLSNPHRDRLGKSPSARQKSLPHLIIRPPRPPAPLTNESRSRSPNIELGPKKRQKFSHLPTAKSRPDDTPSSSSQPQTATGPTSDKSTINSGRSLKLCSSTNCTGIISSTSSATRCLPCVRRDWKSRRESVAAKASGKTLSSKRQGGGGEVAEKGKKKCVSWADDVTQGHSPSPTPSNELLPRNVPKSAVNDAECLTSTLSTSKADAPKEDRIAGWDSDLSELSDSPEADENHGSPSKQDIKSSSGLKIRIPARPAGSYSKKCASQKCEQTLEFGYKGKSCLMCRARRREVNRKRHTLVSLNQSLLEVLTDEENMGTPLSMDLQTRIDDVKLVQGARLCATKRCTYIIPPIDEYNAKKCTFCLIRSAEREHLEQEGDQLPSQRSKLVSQPGFWLQQLDHDRIDTVDESGRCRRYGCGMLLSDSSSRECKQCFGRRNWLTNKFTGQSAIADNLAILHRGSRKPLYRPRGATPYPRYKGFMAALKEFKNLLTGFLRAQSIFFLFQQPQSSNAFFAFDAEFSIVTLDFDLNKRKEEVEAHILKLKATIEYVGRINFNPKRLVSVLDGGGVTIRFSSMYPVPMLKSRTKDGESTINSFLKFMQCELEIAVVPDHSHLFIPGQRTIIRFRLFG